MYICRAGLRWRIEQIFGGIYFNVHGCGPEGRKHEYTIICPPHKQEMLACTEQDWPPLDGSSNGGSETGNNSHT
jgi:hypothetical protein